MSRSITALALLWLLLGGSASAEPYPYTATIASLNVTARSGPSFGAYPTERLSKRSQVEVLQAGAAGWVGIRPPSEAFDWLPASAVKLSADRKEGEVSVDSAPAYIGSNVRKVEKHVAQHDLKRGDSVRVLAEKTTRRSDGTSDTWLKIAPPAAEVRWVQVKQLSTQSPEQLASAETADRLAREERYRRENAANPPGLLANVLAGRDIADARRDDEVEVERAQYLRRGRPPLLSRKPRNATTRSKDEPAPSVEIDNGQPSDALGSEAATETSPRSTDDKPAERTPRPRISLDPKTLPKLDRPLLDRPATIARPPATSGSQARPIDAEEFN